MSSLEERDSRGPSYWRSLNERAETPEFRKIRQREFPEGASELKDRHSRRGFLQLMGASISLAGMAGCRWPEEKILPFAYRAPNRTPGVPQRFCTAMDMDGSAQGLLVTSYDGRPIKVEGNPGHPLNKGAADRFAQASVLDLYDPDRSRQIQRRQGPRRGPATWDDFLRYASTLSSRLEESQGRGLRVLSAPSSSPALQEMRRRLVEEYPQTRWHEWTALSRDNEREGSKLAFGQAHRVRLHLEQAAVIAAFDCDFLDSHPEALRHAREFAAGRRADDLRMNRLHAVESTYTLTGAMADHRRPAATSAVPALVAEVAGHVKGILGSRLPVDSPLHGLPAHHRDGQAWTQALARDLADHPGHSLLVAGPHQPPEVHALCHAVNQALGNAGHTVRYIPDPDPERSTHTESIRELARDLKAGEVDTLIVLGGNPAFDAPADLDLRGALLQAGQIVHLGLHLDETARAALDGDSWSQESQAWHIPRCHYLEEWGDARAFDGTYSVVQPLIAPLYDGKSPVELLAAFLGGPAKGYDLVRESLRRELNRTGSAAVDFEADWRLILQDGRLAGSAWAAEVPRVRPELRQDLSALGHEPPALGPRNLEAVFLADPCILDGRFANNGWLQETPKAMTLLTWDNAALFSPATARELGLEADDLVTLELDGRKIRMPVYVLPGQAPYSVGILLGYGRKSAGRVGHGTGFDAYPLRSSQALHAAAGLTAAATGRTYPLACVQDHQAMDAIGQKGMDEKVPILVREGTLQYYREHPEFAGHMVHHPPLVSLWEEHEYKGHRWGMVIDLSACTGCRACVVACTAENNVPVVGKPRVRDGREMHWLRIDRYFQGDPASPRAVHQPVACVHCENAPCEQVCPVAATLHDAEGINNMVYNRCIGTRYCANNCPYKVRRFNFFNFRKDLTPTEKMAQNPEVTLRSRGVMEKCTYCLQRINAAKIAAKNERRPIRDGEIQPACAQSCPTGAIVFGDLNDPNSRVARLQKHQRSYATLSELNIKPRTMYMARLRNPLDGEGGGHGPEHGSGGHHG